MSKPQPPEAPQLPTAQQCFQWARGAHDALTVLLEQADTYVPDVYGMDGDTADEIAGRLRDAVTALATAYGVFHLAANRVQADANARYAAAQQQAPQYAAGGSPWAA
jgi:hypothetical protein